MQASARSSSSGPPRWCAGLGHTCRPSTTRVDGRGLEGGVRRAPARRRRAERVDGGLPVGRAKVWAAQRDRRCEDRIEQRASVPAPERLDQFPVLLAPGLHVLGELGRRRRGRGFSASPFQSVGEPSGSADVARPEPVPPAECGREVTRQCVPAQVGSPADRDSLCEVLCRERHSSAEELVPHGRPVRREDPLHLTWRAAEADCDCRDAEVELAAARLDQATRAVEVDLRGVASAGVAGHATDLAVASPDFQGPRAKSSSGSLVEVPLRPAARFAPSDKDATHILRCRDRFGGFSKVWSGAVERDARDTAPGMSCSRRPRGPERAAQATAALVPGPALHTAIAQRPPGRASSCSARSAAGSLASGHRRSALM